MELHLAGRFRVIRDGTELADGQIGSRKSRTLLKLLTVERPALVPMDRIVAVLWPAQRPAAPEQNVATLVSRLRAALGADLIQGGRHGYGLATGPEVVVDLDAAARFCEKADSRLASAPAVALAAAERAHELLSAGTAVGDEPYADWADPAREQVRGLLRQARLAAAEAALATGDARLAMVYADAAMAADPLDETAHRWYMSASAAAGEQAKALAAYEAFRQRLGEELGADPAPQTRALHLAILRGQDSGGLAGGRDDADGGPGRGLLAGAAGSDRAGPRPGATGTRAAGIGAPGIGATGIGGTGIGTARIGATGTGTAGTAGGRTLAGRDREIGSLREAWRAAASGRPGLVLIVGEAGIGKTALAEFLAAEATEDGGTVLRTRCYETERSLFLQPVVEAIAPVVASMPADELRQMLGEHTAAAAGLLPEVAAVVGPPPLGRGSMEMERRRAFEAVRAFLRGLSERNPVLVLVDDLQYAGQSTVELLHFLGRQQAGARLLVVTTIRAENDGQTGAALAPVASRVEVGPLSSEAVTQLARAAGHGERAAGILERTRGHTLFVVEVLRALASGHTGLPASLRTAVQARVRRAGQAVEALLRAAAVLGATVDPLTLGVLLDLVPATALELCEAALEARLLTVSGRDYEFANDLIREALYASTPEPTRLAHHRRAADLLTGQPESLARHAAAAGDWLRAARAWLRAGDDAMGRFASSDAAALATLALEAAERVGNTEVSARALMTRGRAYQASGAYNTAFSDLTLGVAEARAAGDQRLEMLVLRELGGDVPASLGLPVTSYTSNLETGLQIAVSLGDRATEADLLARLAVIAASRLRLDAALEYSRRAVTVGRASAQERAIATGLDGLKIVCLTVGDARGLAETIAELRPLLRRLGDLFRLQWAEFESAFVHIAAADWDKAAAAMQTAIEINRRGGYPHFASWYMAHLGWLARLRGRDDEAVTLGRQALTMTERHEHTWAEALACEMLGGTLLLAGERSAAVRLYERGLATAGNSGMEAYLLRCAAPLADATGSPAALGEADSLFEQACIPDGSAWIFGYESCLSLARAWLGCDEPERARTILAPVLAVAEREPWTAVWAAALVEDGRALIRLGERERATSALDRAARLAGTHGLPYVLRDAREAQRELV